MRLQHRIDIGAEQKIGEADDAGADARRPVAVARRHRRDAVDELGLADGREFRVAVGAIHRVALQEHRGADIMAAAVDVALDLVEQIARAAAIPQMMMRIDDRHRRIDRFLLVQRQPILVDLEKYLLLHLRLADIDAQNLHDASPFMTLLPEVARRSMQCRGDPGKCGR